MLSGHITDYHHNNSGKVMITYVANRICRDGIGMHSLEELEF